MNIPYLYDAGALIAIDNNDRRMWARHSLALEDGRSIRVPSVVVMAAGLGAVIWTSGPSDVRTLIDAQGVKRSPVVRTV
ncbi:hypothetical protein [Nocardiopsis composta]|uniref:Uncharacterized protein n=1 Tax=Nocardiopsis composta TaxID=157465 RepID=A0A7W8VFM7_9ACTN|nr:hypothetical protein [Nocardiopsis composta]MBB5434577.1 hypothetical protein [Nocardiopsis composta]